jgi:hypothetical protein
LVALAETAEESDFAVGGVDREGGAVFDDADFLGEDGALVEKAKQLGVDGVDLLPEGIEGGHGEVLSFKN